ncbi:hypothetical protein KFK09_016092 [Dendrobium nobile]|uniref:Uncharacterized protein n=1 Tax=Dendrobium nobile TaxID=94219 RepID=A0A8T3AXT9_DENNO|nr:hypothetical protein KFK09_016092 [Dendrobium nobile]
MGHENQLIIQNKPKQNKIKGQRKESQSKQHPTLLKGPNNTNNIKPKPSQNHWDRNPPAKAELIARTRSRAVKVSGR